MLSESIFFSIEKQFTIPIAINSGFDGAGLVSLNHPMFEQLLNTLEIHALEHNITFTRNCGYIQEYAGEAEWYKYVPLRSLTQQ